MMYNNVNYITHQAPRISYHAGMRYTLCGKEGIMERLFFREDIRREYGESSDGVMLDRQKLVVGVTGIGSGAGATFTAMGLAFRMGEMTSGVTYLEGQPHRKECVSPYRLLAVDRAFRSVIEKNGYGSGRLNLYKKVNWQVYKPQKAMDDRKEWGAREAPGKIIIVDNPLSFDDIDIAVAVVDPFPPRICAGLETYKRLRELAGKGGAKYRKVFWLINKSDGGMARREAERFLKARFDFEQKLLPGEIFYKAAYSCSQPFFLCKTDGINRLAEKIADSM